MKAFVLTVADQRASIVDLPDPETGAGAVRIRVRAASVNGIDVYQATGSLMQVMPHDLPTVVGRDFAGVVEAVGDGRMDVAIGDEVLGFVPYLPTMHDGAFTEVLTSPSLVLAAKPAGLSFEAAASLGLAGVAALDAVNAVDPKPGDLVVVAGATGGVGSLAVQLSAQRGATVIATARSGGEERFVRALGAAETVDYASGDVANVIRSRHPDGVDALIDLANRGDAAAAMAATIRNGGRLATTMGSADVEGLAGRNVHATNVMASPTPEKLASLAGQAAAGTLLVEIQRTFPLADIDAALAEFSAGTIGKVVVAIRGRP